MRKLCTDLTAYRAGGYGWGPRPKSGDCCRLFTAGAAEVRAATSQQSYRIPVQQVIVNFDRQGGTRSDVPLQAVWNGGEIATKSKTPPDRFAVTIRRPQRVPEPRRHRRRAVFPHGAI